MLVQGVSDSSFDIIGDEFDAGGGYGGLVQFVNKGVNVDGVESFDVVKGDDNDSFWGLVLIKAVGDLVVDFVEGSGGSETVLVFKIWNV